MLSWIPKTRRDSPSARPSCPQRESSESARGDEFVGGSGRSYSLSRSARSQQAEVHSAGLAQHSLYRVVLLSGLFRSCFARHYDGPDIPPGAAAGTRRDLLDNFRLCPRRVAGGGATGLRVPLRLRASSEEGALGVGRDTLDAVAAEGGEEGPREGGGREGWFGLAHWCWDRGRVDWDAKRLVEGLR